MKKIFLLVAVIAFGLLFIGCEDPNSGIAVTYTNVVFEYTSEFLLMSTAEKETAKADMVDFAGGALNAYWIGDSFNVTLAGMIELDGFPYTSIEQVLQLYSLDTESYIVIGNIIIPNVLSSNTGNTGGTNDAAAIAAIVGIWDGYMAPINNNRIYEFESDGTYFWYLTLNGQAVSSETHGSWTYNTGTKKLSVTEGGITYEGTVNGDTLVLVSLIYKKR